MTRDQFLAEMMGIRDDGYWWCSLCLAEKSPQQVTYEESCTTCGRPVEWLDAPNFNAWPDKGRLIDFVMGQEWWREFYWFVRQRYAEEKSISSDASTKYLLTNFADLVAEYRGWKP